MPPSHGSVTQVSVGVKRHDRVRVAVDHSPGVVFAAKGAGHAQLENLYVLTVAA